MFDQLKNLYQLKKQAEELQKQMALEKFSATSGNVTLTLDGNQELVDVQVADQPDLIASAIARDFREAFRTAQDEMKKTMAEKFRNLA